VHNVKKMDLLFRSFVRYQLNLLWWKFCWTFWFF
jgi:hypothetical protein